MNNNDTKQKYTPGQVVIYRRERRCRILKVTPDGKYKINLPGVTYNVEESELEAHL